MFVIPDIFGFWNVKANIGSLVLLERLSHDCVMIVVPKGMGYLRGVWLGYWGWLGV